MCLFDYRYRYEIGVDYRTQPTNSRCIYLDVVGFDDHFLFLIHSL